MGQGDSGLLCLRAGDKGVWVSGPEFLKYCLLAGWPEPDIITLGPFDIQAYFSVVARRADELPLKERTEQWRLIAGLIELIGLPIKFR